MRLYLARQGEYPGLVDRAAAGDPEQLIVDGAAQLAAQLLQLALVDLQCDRQAQQGADVVAQLFGQNGSAGNDLADIVAQQFALIRW